MWLELVLLALDLTVWAQTLALTGHQARRWEPKKLRLRLFSAAARLAAAAHSYDSARRGPGPTY
ncbi:transposase [Lipingzhangella sp. LS1_29]|uniref:Transposase n=1 Tax=Lipingzhangella rawalii TaxID=2055835 RepID=A0ABU2HAG4_9ACTN|nr:transposase [Lipingzhangella rawalii]MDS1272303.1 transposase [Lipingzhangella rawalii]